MTLKHAQHHRTAAESTTRSGPRLTHGLAALGAAAVVAIYSAGYLRTKAATAALDDRDARRRAPPKPIDEALPVLSEPASTRDEAPSAVAGTGRALAPVETPSAQAAAPDKPRDSATLPQNEPLTTAAAAQRESHEAAPVAAVVGAPPASMPPTSAATSTAADVAAAAAAPVGPEPAPAPDTPRYKDGSYTGWGTSRHGNIQATVVIEDGRIARAFISQCFTRYPCSWIEKLPPQVAERQSPEVDYVSGATQSTNAFYFAVVEALEKAK